MSKAILVLEDGRTFSGDAYGAVGETFGEAVFTTGMTGYQETLTDGVIDIVATDHAPHAVEDKEQEFDQAPPGSIGLETALAVVLTELVHPGVMAMSRAVEAMSTAPARILGADGHGGPVEPGSPANLVAFDPNAEWVVEPPFASRSRNSAFLGRTLRGRVVHTMFRGELVVHEGKAQR